jgi:hypothetical protein
MAKEEYNFEDQSDLLQSLLPQHHLMGLQINNNCRQNQTKI